MKTNLVKSALLAVALSFAFTACQKDSLVTEMETGLEKKKVELELKRIRPNDKKNDREIEKDLLKEMPIVKKEAQPTSKPPVIQKSDLISYQEVQTKEIIQ